MYRRLRFLYCLLTDSPTHEIFAYTRTLALHDALPICLHEVSEVEPGSGFLVRDLIRGGEPLRVSERSASQTLKQWDRIVARVVQVGGKHLLSGRVLSFTMEADEALVADLPRSNGKRHPRHARNLDAHALAQLPALN